MILWTRFSMNNVHLLCPQISEVDASTLPSYPAMLGLAPFKSLLNHLASPALRHFLTRAHRFLHWSLSWYQALPHLQKSLFDRQALTHHHFIACIWQVLRRKVLKWNIYILYNKWVGEYSLKWWCRNLGRSSHHCDTPHSGNTKLPWMREDLN